LKPKRNFDRDVKASVIRSEAPEYFRQRLYVNPKTGALYVGEGEAASGKSFRQAVRIDPDTGKIELVNLPFDAEDMCFDPDGLAYLRTFYLVGRFDSATWKEVPFDYGEAHEKVCTSSSSDRREASLTSALRLPVAVAGLHHHGGMNVAPTGNLVVAVNNYNQVRTRRDIYDKIAQNVGQYTPTLFPGRVRWGEIHVFDHYGRALFEDAIPGLNRTDGLGIDKDNNIYAMTTATRVLDGERYFNDMTETLVKFRATEGKVLSPSARAAVPLPKAQQPRRPPDFANGHIAAAWAERAVWFYGGLGFAGKNAARAGGGCDCYNARFALDYFARSFAPEVGHSSVAVLDSNGNLILRVGRYGNVEDGVPLAARLPVRGVGSDTGGQAASVTPPHPRSIGGDEVGLFHASYVAAHTDRRLFIADAGNARIVSVTLDYHTTERVALRDVADAGGH